MIRHLRVRRGTASLRYRNRAKIIVLMCEEKPYPVWFSCRRKRGRGVLPYKRLMGMCHWMRSHFHDWIDHEGVAHFLRQFFIFTVGKRTRMFVLQVKSKVFFIQYRVDTY